MDHRKRIALERARFWLAVAAHGDTMQSPSKQQPRAFRVKDAPPDAIAALETTHKPPRLIPHWRQSWRLWSMRLNAAASIGIAYVVASPEILLSTLNQIPDELRTYLPPLLGFGLFGVVSLVRLYRQGPKS